MKTGLLRSMCPGWLLGIFIATGMPVAALVYLGVRMVYLIVKETKI